LDELYKATALGMQGKIQKPDEPLPLEYFRDVVNKAMREELGSPAREQVSQISGQEVEGGAAYDPLEAAAPSPVLAGTPISASPLPPEVARILEEVQLPPVKVARDSDAHKIEWLPPFPDAALKDYRASPPSTEEQKKVRQAIRDARIA